MDALRDTFRGGSAGAAAHGALCVARIIIFGCALVPLAISITYCAYYYNLLGQAEDYQDAFINTAALDTD